MTEDSATRIGLYDDFHKQLPLHTDHSGLVKLERNGHGDYETVQSRLKELVATAPKIITQRFLPLEAKPGALRDPPLSQALQEGKKLLKGQSPHTNCF